MVFPLRVVFPFTVKSVPAVRVEVVVKAPGVVMAAGKVKVTAPEWAAVSPLTKI